MLFRSPNIKGVSKKEFEKIFEMLIEEKRQAQSQVEQLPDNAEYIYPDSIGKIQKEISNTTQDAASFWSMV